MGRTALALSALLAACGAGGPAPGSGPHSPPAAPPAVTPEELTRPLGHLKLGELTLMQNGKPGLALSADGTVEEPGKNVLGVLGADGRFLDQKGSLLAQLTEEGEVVVANGDYLPVTIDASGSVRLLKENRVIRLKDDGTLEGANPDAPAITVHGVTPDTRRAAMFLLVLASYPVRSAP